MRDLSNLSVQGQIWHMDPRNVFEAQLEGEDGRVVVERTDRDELAIHFMLVGDDQAVSSIYMNLNNAAVLAGLMKTAALDDFRVGAAASPRTDAPTQVVGTSDTTTKSAPELSSDQPKET